MSTDADHADSDPVEGSNVEPAQPTFVRMTLNPLAPGPRPIVPLKPNALAARGTAQPAPAPKPPRLEPITPPAPKTLEEIVDEETVRRRALYQGALDLIQPVIVLLKHAKGQGASVSLELRAPSERDDKRVTGLLNCRSFHDGVGSEIREYWIVIRPESESCYLRLENTLSREEEEEYYDENREWPGPEWEETYTRQSGIDVLRKQLEEAIITDLVEREEGLEKFEL